VTFLQQFKKIDANIKRKKRNFFLLYVAESFFRNQKIPTNKNFKTTLPTHTVCTSRQT
jgi:hypothetical protein